MNLQQAMSLLGREFPELEACAADSAHLGTPPGSVFDEHDFAQLITTEMASGRGNRVQQAFDGMEALLSTGGTAARDWVCSFVEALRDVVEWKDDGTEAFFHYLGPEMRRAWAALDAIHADLAECSILEAEVTMWRAVHHSQRAGRAAQEIQIGMLTGG